MPTPPTKTAGGVFKKEGLLGSMVPPSTPSTMANKWIESKRLLSSKVTPTKLAGAVGDKEKKELKRSTVPPSTEEGKLEVQKRLLSGSVQENQLRGTLQESKRGTVPTSRT